mmetsp:Transcript_3889/g.5230  ORF Transcript_3889/g.5230 Transcript_3889/m.5230 type:complete len:111 (-) Transcript_3889:313-645(-)
MTLLTRTYATAYARFRAKRKGALTAHKEKFLMQTILIPNTHCLLSHSIPHTTSTMEEYAYGENTWKQKNVFSHYALKSIVTKRHKSNLTLFLRTENHVVLDISPKSPSQK